MPDLVALESALAASGFGGAIETSPSARIVYGTDNSVYQLAPVGALVPNDADDVAAIAASNHSLALPFELVARGGGTGTNGQSLTDGLVIDTRRRMNRIVSIDLDAMEAVVQPGVVLGQLNALLQPDGVFFAPHVSTASRATIGGMVATDAAGKGSLVFGRTNRHVLEVSAVLADGTPWRFGPTDADEMVRLAAEPGSVGDVYRMVAAALDGLRPNVFPDVPRGFTGYNLADAIAGGPGTADMAKLLCGSEGTLALLTEIRIRLSQLPEDPHLAVVAYPRFDDAIRDANRLKVTGPIAIECLDERTISLAAGSPAWPRLQDLMAGVGGVSSGSLLLMEYEGATGIERLRDMVNDGGRSTAVASTSDPAHVAAVWKVRSDAVGLLGQAVGGRRSVPFVEDCAVPPQRLEEFVSEFRSVLDGHGLDYGMFGHADVGCIHVRPALDLYDPAHEAMMRTISDEVAALVSRFGGVLWGEHGRGFRGEFLDLDDDTVRRMRMVKTAFDPHNILNPGKLYTPFSPRYQADQADQADQSVNAVRRIDEVPLRVHRDRAVALAARDRYDSAFACNGNGICHHWGAAEVMCPSFKATLDPRLSPKGRADLLRGWLSSPDDDALVEEVADSMRQCLSCGACTGRCPVRVDIPEMKSRFLEANPERRLKRRLRAAVLSRFEQMLPFVQSIGWAVGPMQRLTAPLLRAGLGVVDLPAVASGTLTQRLAALDVPLVAPDDLGGATVVVLPDAFTAFLDPDVLAATIKVLRAVGERPGVAAFVPSGKFDHVTGRRKRFAEQVARQRSSRESLADLGVPLVVIEPAVSLLAAHEYRAIDAAFPHHLVTPIADFLCARLDALGDAARVDGLLDGLLGGAADGGAADGGAAVQLFGHCTEVSLAPDRMASYAALLEAVGFGVAIEATSCCGMAGIFGHEVENQEMSARLFDAGWRSKLDSAGPTHRCASGYSCRSQAKRFGHELTHPLVVVASRLC